MFSTWGFGRSNSRSRSNSLTSKNSKGSKASSSAKIHRGNSKDSTKSNEEEKKYAKRHEKGISWSFFKSSNSTPHESEGKPDDLRLSELVRNNAGERTPQLNRLLQAMGMAAMNDETLEAYGKHVFRGAVAEPYLKMVGLKPNTLDTIGWTTNLQADKVAAAVLHWALDNGASVFCHWFQPLGTGLVRHGQSAQIQRFMFDFDEDGLPEWNFRGVDLLKGETDASYYPNGGLRHPSTAGGFLTIDPTSPIFLRNDTVFVPSCFVSFFGHSLDQKTSLLRASDALTKEGSRLLSLLNYKSKYLDMMVGFEQELFFVPREACLTRLDLMLSGRTIMGRPGRKGQEMHGHYMAPVSLASPVMKCMQEIQEQCFKLGIPLKARHREAAPNQYEFTPLYGPVTGAVDQNLMVMQIIEETAIAHGLTALLHEKPFQGYSGSGKHNNWSISTADGTNLFDFEELTARTRNPELFIIFIAAVVRAVDVYGDLLRMCIATPGNDLRLGGMEAPSTIVTLYLGDSLTSYLECYVNGTLDTYVPSSREFEMGASAIPPIEVPAEDRNRTAFLAYVGNRFEFRAAGSSQNLAIVNTVLGTITAKVFKEFADSISKGQSARVVAVTALKASSKVIFNGDCYDVDVKKALHDRGLFCIDSNVDALCKFTELKNIELFEEMKVFTGEECAAQLELALLHYIGTVVIEVNCMIDMINQYIIPSCKRSGKGPLAELRKSVTILEDFLDSVIDEMDVKIRARRARTLRLVTMISIRTICDAAEAEVPRDQWLMHSYADLLYMDETYTAV